MNRGNQDSEAIVILCSHLAAAEGIRPLEPAEWNRLAGRLMEKQMTPGDLLNLNREDLGSALGLDQAQTERILRLLDRSASLSFEISRYEEIGIQIMTRADAAYPKQLKQKLKGSCPPLFYCAGEPELLNRPVFGFVGSRSVDPEDIGFTRKAVSRTTEKGFGAVSGGAKGIDSIASVAAMSEGTWVIEYLADSMLKKMRDAALMRLVRDGQVLLMSAFNPDAGFHVGNAMARNKLIYAQSEGTLVVRSDLRKGGTWAGATENLKHRWCPLLCRESSCPGKQELIRMGAFPVSEDWDGTVPQQAEEEKPAVHENFQQISMLENLI